MDQTNNQQIVNMDQPNEQATSPEQKESIELESLEQRPVDIGHEHAPSGNGNWLRAATLGALDGLTSNSSLVLGRL